MDLVTACPFRSLVSIFFAVPLAILAGVYAAELSASLARRGWHPRHR